VNKVQIRTPEGIEFALPLAGPMARMLSMIIDLMVVAAIGKLIDTLVSPLLTLNFDLARALSILLYFAVSILYGILCEWLLRGQTLGKRILKLRVVDASGLRLEPSQVIVRNLLRLVDMLPTFYLLGSVTALINSRMQRLGDIAAGTVVVRAIKSLEPDLDQVLGSKYNSLLDYRHLCARLRQKVSPDLAALALQALIRRETLDPTSRVKTYAELAAHFRTLVEFPPEVSESLGDEQYVRNVVEVLYRKC
jgi:uncharacterized RDD family membrane protein YckC